MNPQSGYARLAGNFWLVLLLGMGLSLSFCSSVRGEEAEELRFGLKDGQTVLFLGDSITYADTYIQYLDAYLYTRFPAKHISLINRGIPSETCAGTSEVSHDPPRPDVHTRFTSTAGPIKPDVVFLSYGMNDGIYRSPSEEILKKYQEGMTRLVQRVRGELGVDPIVLTPPPFDIRPFANKKRPADLTEPDYRFPAEDYDQTLAGFAAWLRTQRTMGLKVRVIDLHTTLSECLAERRKTDDNFLLAGDGIHPGPTGHWLMAQAILEGLNAPGTIGAIFAKAASPKRSDLVLEKAALPLPIDPRIDAEMLKLVNARKALGRYQLLLLGLTPGNVYQLNANDTVFATSLAEGRVTTFDLAAADQCPLQTKSQEVLKLVQQRRQILREVWIKAETHPRMASEHERLLKTSTATAEQAAELDKQIRELCQPMDFRFTVEQQPK